MTSDCAPLRSASQITLKNAISQRISKLLMWSYTSQEEHCMAGLVCKWKIWGSGRWNYFLNGAWKSFQILALSSVIQSLQTPSSSTFWKLPWRLSGLIMFLVLLWCDFSDSCYYLSGWTGTKKSLMLDIRKGRESQDVGMAQSSHTSSKSIENISAIPISHKYIDFYIECCQLQYEVSVILEM